MNLALPKILLRHSVIKVLLSLKIIRNERAINFNSNANCFVNLNDPEPRNVFLKSSFDPDFFYLAEKLIPSTGTYFDLGANVGFCSFGLVPNRPKVDYHLFEANPDIIKLLRKSIHLHSNQNIILNHACVSDSLGVTRFKLSKNQTGQSHVSTLPLDGIEIPNIRLDKYCRDKRIDSVDFAKIDLEGHELPVLHGWKNFLSEKKIKAIYIEIIPENQLRYKRETNSPLRYLESLGFNLFLCKTEDFGIWGESPKELIFNNNSFILSQFKANDFPEDFSTDVLALKAL